MERCPDYSITIIVIAYNRPEPLGRLLSSLQHARYDGDQVRLYISIDLSESNDVLSIAENFSWEHGEKVVKLQQEHLGLRRHVLQCGDLTSKFGNIIVLEDDLYVSPNFYRFTKQALSYYKEDTKLAGISLYSPEINETAYRLFEPLKSDGDAFFMQLASSWGQVWWYEQWQDFRSWYQEIENEDWQITACQLPANIYSWRETSWKRYFMKYLITKDKYFVYPYISLTTNFGDKGTHFEQDTQIFQVPLDMSVHPVYTFQPLADNHSIYDIFCENTYLYNVLAMSPTELTIDLYGTKPPHLTTRYLLTAQFLPYKIIRSFDLLLRPHELNVIENLTGNGLFLYDRLTVNDP